MTMETRLNNIPHLPHKALGWEMRLNRQMLHHHHLLLEM
jgi:hypothetical protein